MSDEKEKKEVGFLEQVAGKGTENITMDDMKTPFLVILQQNSPQCVKGNSAFIKGAEAGMFFNSLTQTLYGEEIEFIPLCVIKEWLEWKPERGGFAGKHVPNTVKVNKDDFAHWKLPNGNEIVDTYTYPGIVVGHEEDGPVLFALSKTGIKHAKNWNTCIVMNKLPSGSPAPFFANVWKLKTMYNENDKGSWYTIGEDKTTNIVKGRQITEDEYKNIIKEAFEIVKTKEIDYKELEKFTEDKTSTVDATEY